MFDYKDLNLKIGLECHQQLSSKKLFCNCSTKFEEKNLDLEFLRKLRAVAGEQGYIDIAAAFEEAKHREFLYHGYKDEYCMVDCDEEPPHEINQDALTTALSVAKLFKLNVPDKLIAMRKIITDGSACSSFQRTMLIGLASKESFIETTQGKVRITSLCLEEDACKIEKVHENKVHYSLSRQGIPLLELRTEPDIKTPEQAKEAAEQIGLMLRSFQNVLRGIGTIRQDVNLSINNGSRVEIKGFQDLRMMPKIIYFEVNRQVNMTKQGKKIEKEVRKANENGTTSFLRPLPGAARMYPDTDLQVINLTNELLNEVKIPELLTDKIQNLQRKYDLSHELATSLIRERIGFEDYAKNYSKIGNSLLASLLINYNKEKRDHLDYVLMNLNSGKITKDVVEELLMNLRMGKKINLSNFKPVDYMEIENEIVKILKGKPELSTNAVMGILMNKYRGRVDGKKLIEIINKLSTK